MIHFINNILSEAFYTIAIWPNSFVDEKIVITKLGRRQIFLYPNIIGLSGVTLLGK